MASQLRSRCPKCQAVFRTDESLVGKRVRCPVCKEPFEVTHVQFRPVSASLEQVPQAKETMEGGSAETSRAGDLYPPTSEAAKASKLGRTGRFELRELLGQGAFGRVYKAYDPQLDRLVALKIPTFTTDDKHRVQRFLIEAKAAAALRHRNIVPIYDIGEADGTHFIVSHFVDGQPLSKHLERRVDFRQGAEWVRQLAEALDHAHGKGVIHRDIKPSNIMIDEAGVPQIMDFGLAKRLNEDSAVTTDGSLLGTPAYMAPEQAKGKTAEIGPHSDQYSLGVVLYEMLAGRTPFEGAPYSVVAQIITSEAPPPRSLRTEIPAELERICQTAMHKDPKKRYASASDMATDLRHWLERIELRPRGVPAPRRWASKRIPTGALAAIAGVICLALIAVLIQSNVRDRNVPLAGLQAPDMPPPADVTGVAPPTAPTDPETGTSGTQANVAVAPPVELPMPPPVIASATQPQATVTVPQTQSPVEVARYVSDGQLLATFNDEVGDWNRKAPQGVLMSGEKIVALPNFWPQIALPSGVQLTLAGEGALKLAQPDENQVPRLSVEYGRFLAASSGQGGAQFRIEFAHFNGLVTLVDADSLLAIKAARWLPPGSDPEAAEGLAVMEMFSASGRVRWQQAGQAEAEIQMRHVHTYVGNDPPETAGPFVTPEWTNRGSTPQVFRQAIVSMDQYASTDRSLRVSLLELSKDRRVEMRALAARALLALGDCEPMIAEFSEANSYSFWSDGLDVLRRSLHQGPQDAAKVRESISQGRGPEAKELYRLLWGYSEEQLEKGGAAELVKLLEHEHLNMRVLAYVNLSSITGASGFYRPERPSGQMKTAIQNWKDRLNKGTITYRVPPSPLETYRPYTPTAGKASGNSAKSKSSQAADQRRRWVHDGGEFLLLESGQWEERAKSGGVWRYREGLRNGDFIELHALDGNPAVVYRLYNGRCDVGHKPELSFSLMFNGNWMAQENANGKGVSGGGKAPVGGGGLF